MATRRAECLLPPRPTPIHELSMTSMVGYFSIGQLSYLPGYAPSQLLRTCSLAESKKLEEVLNFITTTKNISVINILLVLNPKHNSY